MQDGQFFDANDVYNLGRSILVFAGGTVESYEKFVDDFSSRYELKVPDFISRLRGFVNISDISYKKGGKETLEKNDVTEVKRLKMRRAILLRSLLMDKMSSIFEMGTDKARIDPGIIHAFLEISEYKHGVRSMEAILDMSLVSDSSVRFDKSALPTEPQLNMHVDGKTFVDLVSRKRPAR